MPDLSLEEKRKFLRGYLGEEYAVSFSVEEKDKFLKAAPVMGTYYLRAFVPTLRKFGAYYLLAFGKQSYKNLTSYDLLESFLHDKEDYPVFYEIPASVLILRHKKDNFHNKRMEDFILHTVSYRFDKGYHTLVLSDSPLPLVEERFPGKIVNLGENVESIVRAEF